MVKEWRQFRMEKPLWRKIKKVTSDYDFGIGDLVHWSLYEVDLKAEAEDLIFKVEFTRDESDRIAREEKKAEAEEEDEDEEGEEEDEFEEEN